MTIDDYLAEFLALLKPNLFLEPVGQREVWEQATQIVNQEIWAARAALPRRLRKHDSSSKWIRPSWGGD